MKIGILGAGAMGAMLGGYLKRAGAEVYFVDPYKEHMDEVSKNGLRLKMRHESEEWRIKLDGASTTSEGMGIFDLAIVLVKGLMTETVLQENLACIGPDTIVATFQNGIGNIDILEKFVPRKNICFGVLKNGANLVSPGVIDGYLTGGSNPNFKELYCVGVEPNERVDGVCEELCKLLSDVGFPSVVYPEAEALIWDKLYLNAIVNIPLAIQRVHLEYGINNDYMIPILRQIGDEVCAVATAKGFPMDADHYWETNIVSMQKNGLSNGLHYTSAILDTMRRRPTEVDFLNGAVVREGKALGIPTPANEFVWRMGKACVDFYDDSF